jgi:hypothetical protein
VSGSAIKEMAVRSGTISMEDFDRRVNPVTMVGEGLAGA